VNGFHVESPQFEKAGNLLHEAVTHDLLSQLALAGENSGHLLTSKCCRSNPTGSIPVGHSGPLVVSASSLFFTLYLRGTWNSRASPKPVEKRDWKLAAQQAALLEKAVEKQH